MKKSGLFIITALLILGAATRVSWGAQAAAGQNLTTVKSIGYLKVDKGLDITVRVEGEFLYQALVLSNPARLVIDIAPAQKIEAQPYYEINVLGMTSIRTGQFTPTIARLVFDFSGPLPAYVIQKTSTGFTVSFTAEEMTPNKPVIPPVEIKPVQEKPVREVKEAKAEAAKEESQEVEGPETEGFYNTSVGVMGGTFISPSSDFQAIYGHQTNIQYGLNVTRTLLRLKRFQFDVSLEFRTFSKSGQAVQDPDLPVITTKFSMTPITLAGRLLYQTKYVVPFIGFGKDWTSFDETSELQNTSGSASGYHFQAGVYLIIPNFDHLRVKLYYKFTKVTASANGFDIGLGGNEYGIGLSYAFDLFKKGILSF